MLAAAVGRLAGAQWSQARTVLSHQPPLPLQWLPLGTAPQAGRENLVDGSSSGSFRPSFRQCAAFSSDLTKGSQQAEEVSGLQVQVKPLGGDHEGVSVLEICRPSRKNAIGSQLLRELGEALNNLRQEKSTRVVVLASKVEGIFCAGADLKERILMTQHETSEFVNCLRNTFTELQNLPMPTIAAIDGKALGGGAELAMACDLRVAGAGAQFAFPETRLAILPGAGGTQRLPRLVGLGRAKELIFTGRVVHAIEAHQIGLVEHLAADSSALKESIELATEIAAGGPVALRMAKSAIEMGSDVDITTGMRLEAACYAQVLTTADRLEGLKAVKEKRKPEYTGE